MSVHLYGIFWVMAFFLTFVMDVQKMFNFGNKQTKTHLFFSSFCSVLQACCLVESYI